MIRLMDEEILEVQAVVRAPGKGERVFTAEPIEE